jgi:hypothetical protein
VEHHPFLISYSNKKTQLFSNLVVDRFKYRGHIIKKNAPYPGAFINQIKLMTYQKGRSSIGSVISLADGILLFDEGVVLAAAPVL